MNKIISVIIPSYNSSLTITHTLDAIIRQKRDHIKDIIVVDSSDDGKMDLIITKYKSQQIKFINAGTRIMPAIQRNIGADAARGEILLFIDSDVKPRADLIKKVYAAYSNGCRAGCGSVVIPEFQKNNPLAISQYYLQFNEYIPVGLPCIKDFPAGCVVFCEKSIFLKVGGFPEIRAAEDVLLGLKINSITNLWFIPDAIVEHIFREVRINYYNNQILLGKYVAIYRKINTVRLPLKKMIFYGMYPIFYIYKLMRIAPRIYAAGFYHIRTLGRALPDFLKGVHYWTRGFIGGAVSK
jgi:glycosyltransferase involved in cell wall biosynthesis